MLALVPQQLTRLALVGAHCDDLAIGAGATLLAWSRAHPSLEVHALVLSGRGTEREAEERSALQALCPGARVTVLDVPDGHLPVHWERAKAALKRLRAEVDPDLLLAPSAHDAHQDHRTLAQLVPTEFRDHAVLGYEVLKWESDLAQPTVFVPASEADARAKWALLHEHYPSQRSRGWFDEAAFLGLMRVRGVQAGAGWAEAFHTGKLVLSTSGAS